MKHVILTIIFCLFPLIIKADDTLPSKMLTLDVIEWARTKNKKFSSTYADQKLFAKKKNFVLYGKIFEKLAKENKLPKGYSLVTDKDLKNIDWNTTGLISISNRLPSGGYKVNASLSPMGISSYRITPVGDSYKVLSLGGS